MEETSIVKLNKIIIGVKLWNGNEDTTGLIVKTCARIYVCEHCDEEREGTGYDDKYFHEVVIPNMICQQCGKDASEAYRPLAPKYSQDTVI
jgi:uncharacterized CHY-type Zn-finger protein